MVCKTCGTQLQNGATFCPNCGLTVHYPQNNEVVRQPVYAQQQKYVYQQPVYGRQPNYSQQPANNYPQQNYGYQQPRKPVHNNSDSINSFLYFFIFIIVGLLTAGIFYVSAFRTKYMEDNYIGTNLHSIFAILKEVGFSGFSSEINDKTTVAAVYVMLISCILTSILAIISSVTAYMKKYSAAVKTLGISLIFPTVSYIMLFIEGIHIKTQNSKLEFVNDSIKLSPAPVLMAAMCIGVIILSFKASKELK